MIQVTDRIDLGNTEYINLDARYTDPNGNPFSSVSAAQTYHAGKMNELFIGFTVLVADENDPDYPKAKEYWVQPYDNNGVTAYHLVEKGAGTTDYQTLSNKPTINDVPLSDNKTASDLGLATAEQGAKANTAIQGVSVNGTEVTPDPTTKKVALTIENGKSAYQLYLDDYEDEHGSTDGALNEAAWLESLQGKSALQIYNETMNTSLDEAGFINVLKQNYPMEYVGYNQAAAGQSIGTAFAAIDQLAASDSTAGKLYLMPNDGTTPTGTELFVTVQTGATTYMWYRLGALNVPSNVLTEDKIVQNLNTGGADKVPSATAVKELNEQLYGTYDMSLESSALSLPTTGRSGTYQNTTDASSTGTNAAWYHEGYAISSGVIDLRAYKEAGYKYLKVTMDVVQTNVHGAGYFTFVKRLDIPSSSNSMSFNDLVSGGYLSSVHDEPTNVCFTATAGYSEKTTYNEIPDDAIGVIFQYKNTSGTSSQATTFRRPKEVKCVGKHVNGDVDNMKEIVVDNPLSDNGEKALSAKQGMILGQKLKDVTFAETKVVVVESGNGQNAFSGYIPVIGIGSVTQYLYVSNSNSRSLVVPIDKTIKAVRFLSRVATSTNITSGYLFLNLGKISPSTIMQSGVDLTKYVVQSWQFDVGETEGVVDKTLNVPIGATHFVTVYYIQGAAPLKSDFYCYKQTGEAVVEDIVAKEVTLNYGTLTGNKTSEGNIFDVNGRIGMKNEAYSFHKYLCTPFIEASGFFNISNNITLHGVLLCYDKDVSYIGQLTLQQHNELPNGTEYIKLCGTAANVYSGVTWEVGQITFSGDETESAIRLRSSDIPIENFGTVLSDVPMRFFLRYFNNEDVCLGYNCFTQKTPTNQINKHSIAIQGNMLTRGYCLNENNIKFDVEGATINDVSYIRLVCAYPKDIDITTSAAPVLYAPDDAVEQILRYETIGGRLIKDRNDYGKTFKMVYNAQVHKHQLDNDNPAPDTDKYYSTMILALPKNYSQEGTPTKLILFKNGATGFDDIFENDEITGREFPYYEQLSYWVDQGYAVMDFHAGTNKYPKADCFGFATGLASAVSAYNFVINTFNIDKEIYLSCKSLGGYLAHIIMDTGVIPVRAAALLAPAIDNKRYCFGYDTTDGSNNAEPYTRDIFIEDMGLEGDSTVIKRASGVPVAQRAYTDAAKDYFTQNIQKLNGFMPMLTGVINKGLNDLLALDCTNAGAFDDVKRLHKIPTKYWVATDDANTPYNIAANYVKTCQNTFSPVYLRTMPSGRGAHKSVDSHENAPKVASITTRLGIVHTNVPVAYVEALDFLEGF